MAPPQVRNLMAMVASLQPALKVDKLFENSFVCEAIVRCLPPLAKKYVLQLLYIQGPVTANLLEEWVLPHGVSNHKVALDTFIQLRILLTQTLVESGVLPREPMPSSNITVRLPSLEELDAYAVQQWEYFLMNSDLAENFQFLLMDANAEFWYIIGEYITNYCEEHGVDTSADLISFLVELSFHVTGMAYTFNTLSDIQRNILKDLADLGLIKIEQSWFIPTKCIPIYPWIHSQENKKDLFLPKQTFGFTLPASLNPISYATCS